MYGRPKKPGKKPGRKKGDGRVAGGSKVVDYSSGSKMPKGHRPQKC